MTAGEEAMLQHALTQISYLKQIAPFTFEIKQGELASWKHSAFSPLDFNGWVCTVLRWPAFYVPEPSYISPIRHYTPC